LRAAVPGKDSVAKGAHAVLELVERTLLRRLDRLRKLRQLSILSSIEGSIALFAAELGAIPRLVAHDVDAKEVVAAGGVVTFAQVEADQRGCEVWHRVSVDEARAAAVFRSYRRDPAFAHELVGYGRACQMAVVTTAHFRKYRESCAVAVQIHERVLQLSAGLARHRQGLCAIGSCADQAEAARGRLRLGLQRPRQQDHGSAGSFREATHASDVDALVAARRLVLAQPDLGR